jgi:hypothetical protein
MHSSVSPALHPSGVNSPNRSSKECNFMRRLAASCMWMFINGCLCKSGARSNKAATSDYKWEVCNSSLLGWPRARRTKSCKKCSESRDVVQSHRAYSASTTAQRNGPAVALRRHTPCSNCPNCLLRWAAWHRMRAAFKRNPLQQKAVCAMGDSWHGACNETTG